MAVERRVCDKCGKNRDIKFFGPDARRKDGRSTRCVTCKRKRRQVADRGTRLMENYGITTDDYARLLAAQGGKCAICRTYRPYNLDVDHDHKLGNCREAVRGLLCKRCNRRLLPAATDSTATLLRAISYLESSPARDVLS